MSWQYSDYSLQPDLARNKKGQYILLKNGKKKRKNIRYKNIAVPARPYMRPALRKVTG